MLDVLAKCLEKSICEVLPYHILHGCHLERGYLIPEIATPLIGGLTGCYRSKVGECYLFSVKLDFEKAKEYRKVMVHAYGIISGMTLRLRFVC